MKSLYKRLNEKFGDESNVSLRNKTRTTRLFMAAFLFGLIFFALACASGARTNDGGFPLKAGYYVKMSDGVRLAVNVYLPEKLKQGDEIPALVEFTRYWRDFDWRLASRNVANFPAKGYAQIKVDVRGTGASEGVWSAFSGREIDDTEEILDWITEQDWSNGKIGVYGISYVGGTAMLAASTRHPAVLAVATLFTSIDLYQDSVFPGGRYNAGYYKTYSEMCRLADQNQPKYLCLNSPDDCRQARCMIAGMEGIPGQENHLDELLKKRARHNMDFHGAMSGVTYSDDEIKTYHGPSSVEAMGVFKHLKQIEASQAPILIMDGWYDAGNASSALRLYNAISNPIRLVIGPWGHGVRHHASPYRPPEHKTNMNPEQAWLKIMEFFEETLKAPGDDPVRIKREIQYYSLGEEAWKKSNIWPPRSFQEKVWYLSENNRLSKDKPGQNRGEDIYKVDFSANTGKFNRYFLRYTDVIYPDRAMADKKLLVYDSPPLTSDLRIAGGPVVFLKLKSTHSDGALHVYLEDVSPEGKVTYLTEGILRLLHRKSYVGKREYTTPGGVYRTYVKKDGEILTPGQVVEARIKLFSIAAQLKKGHRIRVAIGGQDSSVFQAVPRRGIPTLSIQRNKNDTSTLRLPVVE